MTSEGRTLNAHQQGIRDLDFGQHSVEHDPADRRTRFRAYLLAFILHVILIVGITSVYRSDVVRMGTDVTREQGISAFVNPVPGPTGTAGRSEPAVKTPPARKRPAPVTTEKTPISTAEAPEPSTAASSESGQAGQAAGSTGTQGDGPVRLGAGQRLGLIKKVDPVYPPTMQAAGMEGTVVLDAIIHRDGTIGDIKVLRSPNPAFEQPAIDAVKEWRYTPLPHEAILTVTVTFTLRR